MAIFNQIIQDLRMNNKKNEQIQIFPLGAGQQVGRSCIVVTIKDKKIIFDTGIHMLYSDKRRYPDFQQLVKPGQNINNIVDLVIITHFHLDHCGGLPYLTQFCKYSGPIYASTPTKAMIPYMLEDFRKVVVDVRKEDNSKQSSNNKQQGSNPYTYTPQDIKSAISKINSIGLHQTKTINGIKITPYYAGHVLGAAMFYVEYQGLSVLYTGDYNSYADRHLGAAYIPRLSPNIVITQTTYASTIRDTKRDRQRKMLKIISQTLQKGGKVLVPVFALGRAQELSVLLQTYWNRTQNDTPVYFSAGLIQKANFYYKLFVQWENQKIKESFLTDHIFQFKKVKPFDKSLIRAQTPYVLFATPGMLHGGTSMQVFKEWCGDQRNTIIIPGYCVPGTLGNKLLSGIKQLVIDKKQYDVRMRVENISFSAHADAKGIINLLRHLNPEKIVFVHGDKQKMESFHQIVEQQLKTKVYMPANHQLINIPVTPFREMEFDVNQRVQDTGYIMKWNGKTSMIAQKNLLKQVNNLLQLMGQADSLIVNGQINCQLNLNNQIALKYQEKEGIRQINANYQQDRESQFVIKVQNQSKQVKEEQGPPVKKEELLKEEVFKEIILYGSLKSFTKNA